MTPLEKCIRTAKLAGVPSDQVTRFLAAKYIPLPWQWQFHADARHADETNGPVDIGLGGARGPGKSHAVLSQAAIDDCKRIPNLKGLFLRQTGLAAKESFDDLVSKVLFGHVPYTKTGSVLKVGDNGRIVLGGFKDQNDIDKYIGIEYDFIIVEELNQLTKDKYEKLRGSLRTSKPNWRPRMYTSFNPGGIGHEFVRSRYVIPQREMREKDTRFIGSNYRSNPHLNKEYIEYLEALTGDLGMAWREGDWDRFAGQVFSEFSYDRHTIKPFIPRVGDTYMSVDWGYSEKSAFAAYLHKVVQMKTEDGQNFTRVITFKEWYGSQVNPEDWAERIYNDCVVMGVKPNKAIVDGAMLDKLQDGSVGIGKTMMKKWRELNKDIEWCPMVAANKNRIGRVAVVHNWLSSPKYVDKLGREKNDLPYWLITQNCPNLIRTLPLLTYDEHRVDDVDTSLEDHCLTGDTLVLTTDGWREIKTLPFAKITGYDTIVMKLVTRSGKVIRCTPNHKILCPTGWVEAQRLKVGSSILSLSPIQSSHSMEKDTTSADHISQDKREKRVDQVDFTKLYGNFTTARFQMVGTSTIQMGIDQTTNCQTSVYSGKKITCLIIPLTQQKRCEKPEEETHEGLVQRVIKDSLKNNAVEQLLSVTYEKKRENVYDIGIEHNLHAFIVNGGIIVHNSYDSVGYFLYKVKFTAVKAGTHSYHIKSPTVQLQYNANNQQLAFDPKEFANRF